VPLLSESTRIGLETSETYEAFVDNIELPSINFTDEVAEALRSHETSYGVDKRQRLTSITIHGNADDSLIDHELVSPESSESGCLTESAYDIYNVDVNEVILARSQQENRTLDVNNVDVTTQDFAPTEVHHYDGVDTVNLSGKPESSCFVESNDGVVEITRLHQERNLTNDQLGSNDVSEKTPDVATEVVTGTAAVPSHAVCSETVEPAVRNTQEHSLSLHSIRNVPETQLTTGVHMPQQWSNARHRHWMSSHYTDKVKERKMKLNINDLIGEESPDCFTKGVPGTAAIFVNSLNVTDKLQAVVMEHDHVHQLANMIQFESQRMFSAETGHLVFHIWTPKLNGDDNKNSPKIDKSMSDGNKPKKSGYRHPIVYSMKFRNASTKSPLTPISSENDVGETIEMDPYAQNIFLVDSGYEASGLADIIRQHQRMSADIDSLSVNSIPNFPIEMF